MISRWRQREINDFVHSICWLARNGNNETPYLLCGIPGWCEDRKLTETKKKAINLLLSYSLHHSKTTNQLSDCLRQISTRGMNTEEEWQHAIYLMEIYYAIRS
jgi:hypothetical protein